MSPILIVDDDPSIRAMFARALGTFGPVETASGGGEAVRLVASRKYSVILLDLHMPLIDGFVVLHTLATKVGPNRDTPIYVITADTSEQARVKALRHRALFILTKPVPIMTLIGLVSATLKRSQPPAQIGGILDTTPTPTAPPAVVPAAAPSTSGQPVPPPPKRAPMPSGVDLAALPRRDTTKKSG